jgi:hypothetical protein
MHGERFGNLELKKAFKMLCIFCDAMVMDMNDMTLIDVTYYHLSTRLREKESQL